MCRSKAKRVPSASKSIPHFEHFSGIRLTNVGMHRTNKGLIRVLWLIHTNLLELTSRRQGFLAIGIKTIKSKILRTLLMQLKFARPEKRKKGAAFSKMGDLSMWKKLSVLLIPICLGCRAASASTCPAIAITKHSATTTVVWTRSVAYVVRWLWMASLVDVPGDDAVHGARLRCRRLLSLQPSLRRRAPIGIDGSAVGHGLFSIGDSGRALCQRRDSEERVSGKEGRDSLWSVALTATAKRFWASDSSAAPGPQHLATIFWGRRRLSCKGPAPPLAMQRRWGRKAFGAIQTYLGDIRPPGDPWWLRRSRA